MPATLTCIMPMFNSAATVAGSLDSLLAQTFTDWECVVIDDGSTDRGAEIVGEYIRRDPRIRMIRQENKGLPGARNAGMEDALRAGTEFMHFLDSDDWMMPQGYEWLLPAARSMGGSYAGYELCGPDGVSLGRQSPMSAPVVGLNEQLDWNRTMTHAHLFASKMIGDQRFDENLSVVEDYDMWLRLAIRGERWQGVERIVGGYRLRPGSMSKNFDSMAKCIEDALFKAFAEAPKFGWAGMIDLSDARRTRSCGNNALCYATMQALVDPDPRKDRSAALLRARVRPAVYTPADASQHACTALLFGACTAPDVDGRRERPWLSTLVRWWSRCEAEGWLEPGAAAAAFEDFSRKIVHPDLVCDAMLDACAPRAAPLVIVGADRNGRRLARRASARGMSTIVFDEMAPAEEIALLEPLPGVRLVRAASDLIAALAGGGTPALWITGFVHARAEAVVRDAAAHLGARPASIELWNVHRDRIGAANLRRMHAVLADAPALGVPRLVG